jgi:hypothetical protein
LTPTPAPDESEVAFLSRLPAARDFLWQYVHSTPLVGPIGELNGEARAAFERDVVAGWSGWAADGGLRYGQPILTASART